jgi:hypothetical protein
MDHQAVQSYDILYITIVVVEHTMTYKILESLRAVLQEKKAATAAAREAMENAREALEKATQAFKQAETDQNNFIRQVEICTNTAQDNSKATEASRSAQKPTGALEKPKGDGKEPKGDGKEPKGDGKEPKGDGKEPKDDGKEPKGDGKEPKVDGKKPTGALEKPKRDRKKSKGINKNSTKEGNPSGEKKPLPPYLIFCNEQRPKITSANPGMHFTDVGRALGAEWRKLSDAQKAEYKQKTAPLPAVIQSTVEAVKQDDEPMADSDHDKGDKDDDSTVKAVKQDDEPMADSDHDNGDEHDDDEHDDEHDDDDLDLDIDAVETILGEKYPFFDTTKLTPLAESYLLNLRHPWQACDGEDKCSLFREMIKNQPKTMEELSALIKETFYGYLSEPCEMHDGKWHPVVIEAFTEWGRLHQLHLFREGSGLHKLLVDDFPDVKKNMDEKIKSNLVNTWDSFAIAILQECKECPGALISDWDEYVDEHDFRQNFKPDPTEK